MTPLFLYLLKVNIALLLFYLAYRFGLRRLTFYSLNRFYLLFAIGFSSAYPFIDLSSFFRDNRAANGQIIYYLPDLSSLAGENPFELWNILAFVFWAGVAVMALRFLLQLISLLRIHFISGKRQMDGETLRIVRGKINPFSFFRNIYINPRLHSPKERASIIAHEQVHVKEWHTADILAGELNRIFYWFNPGAWLIMTAIRENLEFITDRKVLQNGADAKTYQYSLIKISNIPYASTLANNFNFSHLKIRITMMDKKPSSELHLVKYLVLVPFVAATALAFNVSRAERKGSLTDVAKINSVTLSSLDTLPAEAQDSTSTPVVEEVKVKEVKFTPPKIVQKSDEKGPSAPSGVGNAVWSAPPAVGKKNDTSGNKVTFYKAEEEPTHIELDTVDTPQVVIDGKEPRVIIDGEEKDYESLENLPPGDIYSINVLRGKKGDDDFLIITTKKQERKDRLLNLSGSINSLQQAGDRLALADEKYLSLAQKRLLDSAKTKTGDFFFTESLNSGPDQKVDWKDALLVIDGKIMENKTAEDLDTSNIKSVSVLKGAAALMKYGEKGKKGVIIVTTKDKDE